MSDDHDHSEYEVNTGKQCENCGEAEFACAMCGISMHKCAQATIKDPRIPTKFRAIPDFPEYMVNHQATVRHIESGRYCMLVRVSNQGGAMVNLSKDGKRFTKAAQDLRNSAFPERPPM